MLNFCKLIHWYAIKEYLKYTTQNYQYEMELSKKKKKNKKKKRQMK